MLCARDEMSCLVRRGSAAWWDTHGEDATATRDLCSGDGCGGVARSASADIIGKCWCAVRPSVASGGAVDARRHATAAAELGNLIGVEKGHHNERVHGAGGRARRRRAGGRPTR